mgnify:CR=1 FL=1
MSSILKVDQLQDSGGNAIITSNGSGTITVNNQPFKNGITEADQWRLTANITANADPITSNLERVDTSSFGYIGTGMTESSGIFTFPSTGIWLIRATRLSEAIADDNVLFKINVTTNNSTYTEVATIIQCGDGSATGGNSGTAEFLFDCTDTSTHKASFAAASISSGSSILGDTNNNYTTMTFMRLGDT